MAGQQQNDNREGAANPRAWPDTQRRGLLDLGAEAQDRSLPPSKFSDAVYPTPAGDKEDPPGRPRRPEHRDWERGHSPRVSRADHNHDYSDVSRREVSSSSDEDSYLPYSGLAVLPASEHDFTDFGLRVVYWTWDTLYRSSDPAQVFAEYSTDGGTTWSDAVLVGLADPMGETLEYRDDQHNYDPAVGTACQDRYALVLGEVQSPKSRIPRADTTGKIANGWIRTGHGNGLDADTLDGSHASAFAAAAHTHAASAITNTPAGGIAATDVQTALNELDTEKEAAGTAAAAVAAHAAAADPHTGYQKESEKDAANGYAGLDANARLTSSKIQVSATDRLLGRDTAAAGAAEEITVGGGLEFTGSGGVQRSALTGDVTASAGSGATSVASNAVTNTQLADMAESRVKGRAAGAGSGDPTDLTPAQATALLESMVGDGGAGGTKGLAPAPAAGDAAAGKFLGAAGTWSVPATVIADDSISDAKLRNSAALSVIGRAANSAGDPADIAAGSNSTFLRRKANALAFGAIEADDLPSGMGRLLDVRFLTDTGATTYTPTSGTTRALVIVVAAGGGGGGADQAASNAGAGGGGAAGGVVRKWIEDIAAEGTMTFQCGTAGTGGSAGNNAGNAGNDSTFSGSVTAITAKGGGGGGSMAAALTPSFATAGAPGSGNTGGDVNQSGAPGGFAYRQNGTICYGGNGGSGPYGGGGVGGAANNAGTAGVGHGSGGGGAAANSVGGADLAGGDGTQGLVKVYEFA